MNVSRIVKAKKLSDLKKSPRHRTKERSSAVEERSRSVSREEARGEVVRVRQEGSTEACEKLTSACPHCGGAG